MNTPNVKCPSCGSDNVDFINDNLDDLFSTEDHLHGKAPFVYAREYECLDCGAFLSDEFRFDITSIGTLEVED